MKIEDLLRAAKGDMEWPQLAARASGGKPGVDRIEQIVQYGLKAFPAPETIRGLAEICRVTEQVVLDSCAESLGLEITRSPSMLEVMMPPGTDALPDSAVLALVSLIRAQVDAARSAPQPKG